MSTSESVFALGDDALGVRLATKDRRNAVAQHLLDSGQWSEVVPGAEGVSVQFDPLALTPDEAMLALQNALAQNIAAAEVSAELLVIPVCYSPEYGLDLAHISSATGLATDEIIQRHTSQTHHVDMIGFTPGFAYLEGGDPSLDVSRLDTPRAHLAAGSIGLAGGLCGLYVLPGPGGWPIVGRTPMALFDTERDDPFRLQVGQSIRFEAISVADFKAWR